VYHNNTYILTVSQQNQNWKIHNLPAVTRHSTNCVNYVQRHRTDVYVTLQRLGCVSAVAMITPASSPFCLLLRSRHLSRVLLMPAPHRLIPLEFPLNFYLLFWMFPIKHVNFIRQRLRDHRLVHSCMNVKTTCKLTCCFLCTEYDHISNGKENTSEWCTDMDMEGSRYRKFTD